MPNLTQRFAAAVKPPTTGYAVHWDSSLPGFGLRITSNGIRAWILQYRVRGSRRVRKATLGKLAVMTPAQAREMAKDWLHRARLGEDPGARSTSITMAELVELYRAQHLPKKKSRSQEEDERMLENDILPVLGNRRLDEVTRADIEKVLARVLARSAKRTSKDPQTVPGAYQHNRTRALLRLLFAKAQKWERTDRNPVEHIIRHREKARERLLSDAEMAELGKALAEVEEGDKRAHGACDAIRLLALTGCRLREILHLQWSEVNLEAGVLRLADSKTGGRPVFLSPPAIALLERQQRQDGKSEWVFPSYRRKGRPLNDVRKAWDAACKKAKITGARPHDLRHRYASSAASFGLSALQIKPLTGHRNIRTLEKYVHSEMEPARLAAQHVGQIQAALLAGRSAEVVQIEDRRR